MSRSEKPADQVKAEIEQQKPVEQASAGSTDESAAAAAGAPAPDDTKASEADAAAAIDAQAVDGPYKPGELDAAQLEARASGVLILHSSGRWTWPGCPTDPGSTYLRLPRESVPDAVVKEAIADGHLAVTMVDGNGSPTAVKALREGEATPRVLSATVAGTVDAATE